ncbi:MAG: hypothetical protein O7C75_08440, partial [Verrucomicrobia bacterium]|nr:hypothetical protein [Verrucomicrobiota bacterium]
EELDTDEDGMPDNYEEQHGLAKDVDNADDDLDGEGAFNFEEYAAGTLPDDANSVFKISLSESGEFTATVELVIPRCSHRGITFLRVSGSLDQHPGRSL